MSLLTVHDVHRSYRGPAGDVPVLRGVSLQVPGGGVHAIMGPSGSGKSTLLRLLACLDTPDAGSIRVAGRSLPAPWSSDGDAYRNRTCGIVLQDHLLIDRATAVDNAALPLLYARPRPAKRERRTMAAELLTRLGLGDRLHHPVGRLSGGERQRVAIARAVIMGPSLLLADEPTGALDEERTDEVMGLFRSMSQPERAIVIVTHDPAVAARCDHTWRLRAGRLE
ncbi:ABC transporter ATP-binding protein [Micrococcus luteus]|uniref:ABC transporter ATP-binding protein n=1 Tax=Micrococcus TaxID=1269 RepID=UPI00106D74D4|nr:MULTISPECIES: ABC transporter ATP-binding protein [Micrococcus]MCV7470862.1 ABC transporter ATP-binding protein [Micrococcus luteus]MCV7485878.1 ABC transporter ATP-binding protein [Micrococcus luteus]MCV7598660.1 ABC transporter ATP-binding protein [Micrococcus luteus]TFE79109.1 ABC transporter ATP-binding protein [Micrococcus aloeverae]